MSISIVTINLNNREGLERTLRSLARQTRMEFELIVVDGGSTDGSLDVCDQYQKIIQERIVEADNGIFDAWNKGIRVACGELIGLLNSGDEYHHDVIEAVSAICADHGSAIEDCILCGRTYLVRDGVITKLIGNRLRSRLVLGLGVAHPSLFIGRAVYGRVGFYESISIAADSQFLLRCIKENVSFIPASYCVYMEEGGISQREGTEGFTQYTRALVDLGFCSAFKARLTARAYGTYRALLLRTGIVGLARQLAANARHFGIRSMNGVRRLTVFSWPRRVLYKAYGYDVHRTAFISPFTTFYGSGNFRIGDGSVINRGVTLDNRDHIQIGSGCSISQGVTILSAGHDIDSPYFEYTSRPVIIRDHVAVLAGAWVMPGAVLESGVVVLPGAVISGSTVPNGVYGGVPARFIRMRISEPVHRFDYHRPFAL